jgi:hypothetical protein
MLFGIAFGIMKALKRDPMPVALFAGMIDGMAIESEVNAVLAIVGW